ncbi:MAG: hypothetical protein QOJ65_2738 [Fimbriimonadaceae bacterium]|jgi:hypothetical protein|nr:hypothetical protein [Fimbriimonadaceae bacterium]
MTYEPELWHDFFLMVGGGAAALAGLVFVAMSLNLKAIMEDATHRARASATMVGFTSIFILCGAALMAHQTGRWLGIEWLAATCAYAYAYIAGYAQSLRLHGSDTGRTGLRRSFAALCALAQVAGSGMLIAGVGEGAFVAAGGLMLNVGSLVSGAWLLMVGICNDAQVTKDVSSAAKK